MCSAGLKGRGDGMAVVCLLGPADGHGLPNRITRLI
jgi:hypothetical protein